MCGTDYFARGPNWIHGTENNPILDLAKETGTIDFAWGEELAFFDGYGQVMPRKKSTMYSERLWGMIADACKYSEEHSASIPPSDSLMDFFERRSKELHDESDEERKAMLRYAEMWGAFVGSPVQRQSLKFFWLEECIEGENPFVADTYAKVLARIAEPALKGADVQFGKTVNQVRSYQEQGHSKVYVGCAEGEGAAFDDVVVTAPLGWLKANRPIFIPPLPPRLSKAIDSIGYGCLDKVSLCGKIFFHNLRSKLFANLSLQLFKEKDKDLNCGEESQLIQHPFSYSHNACCSNSAALSHTFSSHFIHV